MPSESSKVNEHAVVHPYYLPRSAPPTKLSFMRLPTSLKGRLSEYWSALPDLNRGPPDGCPQPSVSSLQSGALAS